MRSLLLVLLFATTVAAQEFPDDYTRLLVPLVPQRIAGANGSIWVTEWTAFNAGARMVFIGGPFPYVNFSPPIQDNEVQPGETQRLFPAEPRPGLDGAFVWVATADLDHLPMSLRVRDTSVNAQSYGTRVPLVRDEEFRQTIRLVDVPTDPAFRATLRVYSEGDSPHPVIVRVFAPGRSAAVEELEVALHAQEDPGPESVPLPAFVQLDPLTAAARGAGPSVRFEVSSDTKIWAFASISHNATQQVTAVLP